MSTVVLALDPGGINWPDVWVKQWLRGEVVANNTLVAVDYANWLLTKSNLANAAQRLDDAIHAHPGPKIVAAHSLGSEVAYKWLRNWGPSSDIDPAELRFVLTGNPERKYSGACRVPSPPLGTLTIDAPAVGIPDDARYQVIDLARQYDQWADCPSKPNPNWIARWYNSSQGSLYHLDYFSTSLADPRTVWLTEGTVRYGWVPSPMPWIWRLFRSWIEGGYARPVDIPRA